MYEKLFVGTKKSVGKANFLLWCSKTLEKYEENKNKRKF